MQQKILLPGTEQYKYLNTLPDNKWSSYCNKMLAKGVSVKYDALGDMFVVKKINESTMPQNYLDQEIQSILSSKDEETSLPGVDGGPAICAETPVAGGTFSLQQLEDLLNRVINGQKTEEPITGVELPPTGPLSSDLSQAYGTETILDSDFEDAQPAVVAEPEELTEYSEINDYNYEYNMEDDKEDDENKNLTEDDESDSEVLEEYASEYDAYDYYGEQTGKLTEEDEIIEPVTTSSVQKLAGQPVQIILTGVMISPSELSYIGESAKKAGIKLKRIEGEGNRLKVIVENNKKQYTVNYEEISKLKTKTPFSIKNETFTTLNEAFDRITLSQKKKIQESLNFRKFLNEDILTREISNVKESDILVESKPNKNYVTSWNVKSVGTVNLKTGLNEVYSNILEHTEENNTLIKTREGQYFLMKGNLKERSAKGIVKQLMDLQERKDFGVGKVVGVFPNNVKGLNQIMSECKKTVLPLLIWK